ncbi:MAG TPA: Ig-like domain-containing protein, partial [Gemmatimonadales bacterium]|nr:Ig-like domain-containing protein [Gemmatimonadales bacterium]
MACVFQLAKLAKRLALIGGVIAVAGACGDDLTAPGAGTSTTHPIGSLVIDPAAGSGAVGTTLRFTARLTDSAGNSVQNPAVAWESFDPAIATVDGTGLVRALAPGMVRIIATSGDAADTAMVTIIGAGDVPAGLFVAPNGSADGDGTIARPWDLATALAGAGGRIEPDATVWLRGGTYRGAFRTALTGEPGSPIVFRQYPGERATIDGGLRAEGADLVFWGFEIMQSNPLANGELPGLLIYTLRGKFINLVVHDAAQQGITFWDGAT